MVEVVHSLPIVCEITPLKTMVSTLRLLSDEAIFKISDEGIRSSVVDSSHVCLLEASMPKKTLTSLDLDDEIELAISLESFESALKLGSKKDSVKITFTEDKAYMVLDISGLKKSIRLLDISLVKSPPTPKIDFALSFDIDGSSLNKAVKAVKTVGDATTIHYDGDILLVRADSKMENVEAPLEVNRLLKGKNEAAATLFSTSFLVKMTKSMAENINISFGENQPFWLESNDGKLTFTWFLAPRISTT